jgi:hypothetical protein
MKKLLKLLKIAAMALLVIFILASAGIVIFIKTFNANKYKPQIIKAISQALGRPAAIDDISLKVSLRGGLVLQLKGFRLNDDPAFSKDNFLEIPRLDAAMDIIGIIFKHRISLAVITIDAPKTVIIRDASGRLNLQTFGMPTASKPSASALPAIFINSFKINNAAVIFKDKAFSPGLSILLDQLNFEIKDFSLDKPFDVLLQAAAFSPRQNFNASAKLALDLIARAVKVCDARASVDLGSFSLEQLSRLPMIKPGQLPEFLSGKVEIVFAPITVSKKGLSRLSADITLTDGVVAASHLIPGLALNLGKINGSLKNFSPDFKKPFDASVKMQYLSDHPNVSFNGQVTFDPVKTSVRISNAGIGLDLTNFSLSGLKADVAALKDVPLPVQVGGTIDVSIVNADISAKGLESLAAKAKFTNGLVKLDQLNQVLSGISVDASLNEKDLTIDNLSAGLGKGSIRAKGVVKDYLSGRAFELEAEIKDIELGEVIEQSKAQIKVSGLAAGNFKAAGHADDLKSIKADGVFTVKPVTLKNFNILKTVLEKISFLPNASEGIKNGLSNKYAKKLESPDTEINSAVFTYAFSQGTVHLEPVSIDADEFIFSGKADADLAQAYTVEGNVTIPAELSAAMAKGVDELKYLYDDKNSITIPVYVKGQGAQAPKVEVTRTAAQLTKSVAVNKGAEALGKLINKYTGGDNASGEENNNGSEVIKGILNKILK